MKALVACKAIPPSNRFVESVIPKSDWCPLKFGQCLKCGLLQLISPMPYDIVRSRHPWLSYSEPEAHLDALVDRLKPSLKSNTRVIGITTNDDSTLARFSRLGNFSTYRYDIHNDLGLTESCAGLESIQNAFNSGLAAALTARHGKADLLVVRYLLEHAHSPRSLLTELGLLLAPGGKIVLEVPSCEKFIESCDYNSIWEEHVSYFSQHTFSEILRCSGFEVKQIHLKDYPLEDSLVAIAVKADRPQSADAIPLAEELRSAQRFSETFSITRDRYREFFGTLRNKGKGIALFGAGHFAAMFLNLHELGNLVDFVVDDNPNKQGCLMPGTRVPIFGSDRLSECDICMLCINPDKEEQVVSKYQAFINAGGEFSSIFERSKLALRLS